MAKKTYTIRCHVKNVELGVGGITSLTICPTGKSRIEGMEDKCLGFDVADLNSAYLFPLKIEKIVSLNHLMVDALIKSKVHDCKIEMKVETDNQNNKIIKICGVTLL